METHFIGTKELRQNMAKVVRNTKGKNQRFIVMRKNKPVFELRPLSTNDMLVESFRKDIEEARSDKKSNNTYSQEEVEKILGL
jgi:antitoxin (DNA-binding transcriptional repressor) of toxin-antitoxin stability system